MAILIYTAIVALAAAFILALLNKWGIIEWMQVHAPSDFFHRLVSCHFCLSFWCGLFIVAVLLVFIRDPWLLAAPFLSVPLSARLW